MKSFFIASLFVFAGSALAQPKLSNCYVGTIELASGESKRISLLRDPLNDYSYMNLNNDKIVQVQLKNNQLETNLNDDYIPGGNASYNIDLSLKIEANSGAGTYLHYNYADGQGYGGLGAGKKAGMQPDEQGIIKLTSCH